MVLGERVPLGKVGFSFDQFALELRFGRNSWIDCRHFRYASKLRVLLCQERLAKDSGISDEGEFSNVTDSILCLWLLFCNQGQRDEPVVSCFLSLHLLALVDRLEFCPSGII